MQSPIRRRARRREEEVEWNGIEILALSKEVCYWLRGWVVKDLTLKSRRGPSDSSTTLSR